MNQFNRAVENFKCMKDAIEQLKICMDEVHEQINMATYRIAECELIEFDLVHVLENIKTLSQQQADEIALRLVDIRKERRDLKSAMHIYLHNKKVAEKLRPSFNEARKSLETLSEAGNPHYNAYKFRTKEVYDLAMQLDLDDKGGLFHFAPPSGSIAEEVAVTVPKVEVFKPSFKEKSLRVDRINKTFKIFNKSNEILSTDRFMDVIERIVELDPDVVYFSNGTIEMFNSFKKSYRSGKMKNMNMTETEFELLTIKAFKG